MTFLRQMVLDGLVNEINGGAYIWEPYKSKCFGTSKKCKKTSEERNTKGLKFVVEMLQYCVVNCN